MPHTWDAGVPTPEESLRRLIEGNVRFRASSASAARSWDPKHATESQRPFAIVLGCSDSRTPVEILFDQGFGDLFVVRVAGNVVAPSVVGSIEFAASQFGSRLVVVMGHTGCGAVTATVHAIETGSGSESRNIRDITDRIAPHIEGLVRAGGQGAAAREAVVREAVRANVRASVDHLRHGSRILEDLVVSERLVVVGAEYDLSSGEVVFFDRAPRPPG
ncbi:MAG TPA: carbonic anhydrase [Candidatus Omnitrophota bacterium]|jgi:carbonic anhydrase|nr:carbonic anhydrase [Candidatus Omnitrophota bacterium]